jgi:hypothetical protein
VQRLARTALALVLAAWTAAVAAMPPCADGLAPAGCSAAAPAEGGDAHDDTDAECDLGCASCACCKPPVAASSGVASLAPQLAGGRVSSRTLGLAREGAAGEIFQPPRA